MSEGFLYNIPFWLGGIIAAAIIAWPIGPDLARRRASGVRTASPPQGSRRYYSCVRKESRGPNLSRDC